MTVALIGIGGDSTNMTPIPPVYPDGTFEYLPIPESKPSIEPMTYGHIPLRHDVGTAADYLDGIDPDGNGTDPVTGTELANWQIHHDPNFAALTYGETGSRGAYTALLRDLATGDVIAFYTGLQGTSDYTHRYLIGYMTVETVYDCREQALERYSPAEQAEMLDTLAANAHVKRYRATGEFDDGLVLIDGKPPGGRLEQAIRISTHHGGGHHYLTESLQQQFQPAGSGQADKPAYLGGVKQAHRLQLSADTFRKWLGAQTTVVPDGHWLGKDDPEPNTGF